MCQKFVVSQTIRIYKNKRGEEEEGEEKVGPRLESPTTLWGD